MNPNDDLNQLGYTSSQPDFDLAPKDVVKPQDEADAPTLERIFKILEARKAQYRSTDWFTLGDITLENQFIIGRQMQAHIQELESLISSTITKVREHQNERGQ